MKTFIVDAFTDQPFKGNPTGVCLSDASLPNDRMLSIARELNLSETAFVHPSANEIYTIRYFSPKMEIPLCGHATMAAAQVLFEIFNLGDVTFRIDANLELVARRIEDCIEMVFPVYETSPAQAPSALLDALGLTSIVNAAFNRETKILLLEIANAKTLAELRPNYQALLASHNAINGVLVTAPSDTKSHDFHSRYFWPWSGTDEDPVTGGTCTFLAKYWATCLGKTKLRSFQSSRRTGSMELRLVDGTVMIKSRAIIFFKGDLVV